jgi:glucose/arabinose dehydrogenase
MRYFFAVLFVCIFTAARAAPPAPMLPSSFRIQEIVSASSSRAVAIRSARDGSARLFVLYTNGKVKILRRQALQAVDFLDLPSLVGQETGLLGLAFHPNFLVNRKLYVYQATGQGGRLFEYKADLENPDVVEPGSQKLVFEFSAPLSFAHRAGDIAFGPDGMLYIAIGDGRQRESALNPASLLGKILRIDVNQNAALSPQFCGSSGLAGSINYAIPSGNPFANSPGMCGEVWLQGLRNPYRFSFDRMTGDIYIADVGENSYEEINIVRAGDSGQNFGWPCKEGPAFTNFELVGVDCSAANWIFTDPAAVFGRLVPPAGYAGIGGYVYRGESAALQGIYFFGDFGAAPLYFLRYSGNVASQIGVFSGNGVFSTFGSLTGFGEDENGDIYAIQNGGRIFLLTDRPEFQNGFE